MRSHFTVEIFCGEGTWANKVSHPSHGITKEYIVTTNKPANKQHLRSMMQGCLIDGSAVKPLHVELEKSDPAKRNKLRIVIAEGKHREVAVQRV